MNEKELSFVTTVELDTDGVQTMLEKAAPIWSKKRLAVLVPVYCVCLVLSAICDYYLDKWDHVIIIASIGIAYVIAMVYLTSVTRKKRKQAFLEQYPDGKLMYENGFAEDGLHVHNVSNGAHAVMSYDVLKKLVVAGDMWVLVSKSAVCTPVHVGQLSETDRESLLAHLKKHNPKINIQLPKKK